MTKTTASLFTGGAGFEQGAMMAGYTPVWGVEIRPDIARCAERNTPGLKVIVSDVADVDYEELPKVDHLHASPSCKRASVANADAEEAPEDIDSAWAVRRAIREQKPKTFTLENVWAYREFEAFKLIVSQLTRLGYKVDWWHLNAADYGVPQTRKRLILIARLDQQPRKPAPTHSKTPDPWGIYKPWVGWLEAIADLVDTLPDSEFAPWQLSRLPDELKSMLLAQGGYEGQITNRSIEEPAFTVTSNSNQAGVRALLVGGAISASASELGEPVFTITADGGLRLRALLIPGDNTSNGVVRQEDEPMVRVQSRGLGQCPHRAFIVDCQKNGTPESNDGLRGLTIRDNDEPIFTITANQNKRTVRAGLPWGRVVKMTPRALARLQSIPDHYQLPNSNGLACEIIGNAVPPLLAKAICEAISD